MNLGRSHGAWRWIVIGAAAAVMALSLTGLGNAMAKVGSEALASRSARVTITTVAFQPKTLHVSRGTTVTFFNSSKTSHTATRRGSFETGVIKPGKSASIRFTKKGTFSYFCRIHPFMHGTIVVE
jgi:plastocyanin